MSRVSFVALVAGVTLIGLPHLWKSFAEGPNFVPLQGADTQQSLGNQDYSVTASNSGSFAISDPKFDPNWVLPAALIASFAAGYGVRSLVSSRRHRRARRSRFSGLTTSHRLQLEADNSHTSIVPRDDVGDLQSARPAFMQRHPGGDW